MTDTLSREEVEEVRNWPNSPYADELHWGTEARRRLNALCDMALRSLDAVAVREATIQECARVAMNPKLFEHYNDGPLALCGGVVDAIRALGQSNAATQDGATTMVSGQPQKVVDGILPVPAVAAPDPQEGELPPYPVVLTGICTDGVLRIEGEFVTRHVYDLLRQALRSRSGVVVPDIPCPDCGETGTCKPGCPSRLP